MGAKPAKASGIPGAPTRIVLHKQINMNSDMRILRVGVIGLGEIAQVNHISLLNSLCDYFVISYLCDASPGALAHCARKVASDVPPKTTSSAEELCSSPDVDVVLICSAHVFHPSHAMTALKFNKHVLCEKPVGFCMREVDALIEAEKKSKGKIMIAYQRRFAAGFSDVLKEVGGLGQIQYVRVRDIVGTNSWFVNQSGTFPIRFDDYPAAATRELELRTEETIKESLRDFGIEETKDKIEMFRWLSVLGSHDLSAMRELIGMPQKVLGASLQVGTPLWSVLFQYPSFPCVYESGENSVPIFDAHIEVYSQAKIVRVNYDTPYVKGLPVTMTVRERIEGHGGQPYGYQERTVRRTYEDPYLLEFMEFYNVVTKNKPVKTSPADARNELLLLEMIMKVGYRS